MAQSLEGKLQIYFTGTLYVGTASTDVTTSIMRRLAALTQTEMTARLKAMIVSAGTSN